MAFREPTALLPVSEPAAPIPAAILGRAALVEPTALLEPAALLGLADGADSAVDRLAPLLAALCIALTVLICLI
ncbi:hypothetical protein SKPI104516_18715 [Skermania piniformis]